MTGATVKVRKIRWWELAWGWVWARGDRQFRRNQALFIKLLKDPRSGLETTCRNHAQRMANAMMMNFLDSRRVQHCRFCPTTGPLVKIGPDYYCRGHQLVAGNKKLESAMKGGT